MVTLPNREKELFTAQDRRYQQRLERLINEKLTYPQLQELSQKHYQDQTIFDYAQKSVTVFDYIQFFNYPIDFRVYTLSRATITLHLDQEQQVSKQKERHLPVTKFPFRKNLIGLIDEAVITTNYESFRNFVRTTLPEVLTRSEELNYRKKYIHEKALHWDGLVPTASLYKIIPLLTPRMKKDSYLFSLNQKPEGTIFYLEGKLQQFKISSGWVKRSAKLNFLQQIKFRFNRIY